MTEEPVSEEMPTEDLILSEYRSNINTGPSHNVPNIAPKL